MRRFLLINLYLSSFFALLFISCSPASGHKLLRTAVITENDVHPIVNKTNALLYKAKIDVFNKHYSGLIVLKQLDKENSRLAFVTEIGMKMFEFEIRDTVFNLVYMFEPLNKPKIIQLLKDDMKLILLHQLINKEASVYQKKENIVYKVDQKFRYYYVLNDHSKNVRKTLKKGSLFTKVKVNYFYNDSLNARLIRLKHKGLIRLKIELNNLNKTQP